MHFSRSLSVFPVLLLAVSAALPAQVTGSSSGEVAHIDGPQTNKVPYTLTRTSTNVQTLANGATITHSFTVKSARDSEGRTYSEIPLTLPSGPDPHVDRVHYSVLDPVARTNIIWDNRTKIAIVTHMAAPETVQSSEVDAARQPRAVRAPKQVTREDLGVRTIVGVEARGTRTTLVVPAGEVGNDQPFTIVTEDWISTQYHIPLLTVHDDPRSGKRTDEVTEFQPGEPNPALFKVPEGYTVRERTASQPD
jgi:VCBS repeat-containing protein